MAKDILRAGQSYVAHSESLSRDAGKALIVGGSAASVMYLTAGLIPFLSFPVLAILVIVLGLYLRFKD